ncbi:RNA helicase [Coniophora puteana RWD-64-598 SS2]|uniref:RNA helicase n=1 Tax=Coniophora puteana (strain RWD-64-598) TaxID=741705 RepID=R7SH40_CONPW|nr:RNA helicase [Coniophora puteana RWD-64-598 SS2]EIW74374.1 RNA helicase [Coniophora puteana RWD-64-598 SS2]
MHVAGKKHLNKLRGASTTQYCSVCKVYAGVHWEMHINGRKHIRKAAGDPSANVPAAPESIPGITYCALCNVVVIASHWSGHLNGSVHRKKTIYSRFKQNLDDAEKDKHGVTVSEELDFGVVELEDAAQGVSKTLYVQTDVPSSRISISEVKMLLVPRNSPSSFCVSDYNTGVPYGKRNPIIVTFRQSFAGHAIDRVQFTLKDHKLDQEFAIVRSLRAVSGSKEDYERFKPKTPYVSRPKTKRREEKDVVAGEFPQSTKAIPYIVALPKAPIPERLMAVLSQGSTQHIVQQLRNSFLPPSFTKETYGRQFKTLVWAEEFRMERDLEHYDIADAKLRAHSSFNINLDVPGLAEKRPSVLVGDRILVHRHGDPDGKWYEGGVHVVHKEEVGLKFGADFKRTWTVAQPYVVRFKLNRYPVRRQHQALDTAFAVDRLLFPVLDHVLPFNPGRAFRPFNPLIARNPPQLLAVTSILRQPPGSSPFVIFGPPGTGKTITAIETIRQILAFNPNARILATAPSNSAADLIALRLAPYMTANELFRLYAPSRYKNQTPDELEAYTYMTRGHYSTPPLERFSNFRVIVSTCVSASIPYGIGIQRGHFSHIFVDEAGQATEPEVMISIKTIADNATNVVLSGDPKQLGPIIRSGVARELGLEKSFMERLMERDVFMATSGVSPNRSSVKLTKNFRSNPAILRFPNERFYSNDLEACGDPGVINAYLGYSELPSKTFPIIFHAVTGKDDREATSPSYCNIDEVTQVKKWVEKLKGARRGYNSTDSDIGVITPYHLQCLKIRASLRAVADGIKVGSVEEFQGQERKVIILSTVRSSRDLVEYDLRHTLGFVANPRRFNVAITRAKALLIVIGDPNVLSLDPLWRSFMNYIHLNNGWMGPQPEWDTRIEVDESGGYDAIIREAALVDMNEFSRRMEQLTLATVHSQGYDGLIEESEANVDRPWRDVE